MLHRTEKKGMNILPNRSMLCFRRILIKKAIIILIKKAIIKVQALLSAGQKKRIKKAIIKVQVLLSAGQKKRFQKNSINRYGYGMIIHGGASMKKMIHFVTYGSSGLKTQQKLLRSEIHQTQEAFSLLLPSVFLKN